MKIVITIIFFVTFLSTSFAQDDLLPAYLSEIKGEGVIGDRAYFINNNRPFTGILVDEKTNKKIGEYKNGYKNGIFTKYYLSGIKKSEYKYTIGQRDGKCSEWFENKQLKSSYTYNNGDIEDGKYITYFENGQKEKDKTYKNGQIIFSNRYKDDKIIVLLKLIIKFHPNGKKKSEGYLKNGWKDGLWVEWWEDGLKKSIRYYKDGLEYRKMPSGQKKIKKKYKKEEKVGLRKSEYNMSGESGK